MAVDLTALRTFVGATVSSDDELTACIAVADALIADYIAPVDDDGDGQTDWAPEVPAAVLDRATLLVAAETFHQGRAPNGYLNQQFDDGAVAPVRVSSDPLRPAYPLLRRFVPPLVR